MKEAAQIIGIFAIVTWIFSIQKNKKSEILHIQAVANIFYGIQYLLLGAYSVGIICLISSIRCWIFGKDYKLSKSKGLLLVFISLIIITGILTNDGILSLIPVFIYILYTYSSWLDDLKKFRVVYILCAFVWFSFNISVKAYAVCIGNILEIISGIRALLKYNKRG